MVKIVTKRNFVVLGQCTHSLALYSVYILLSLHDAKRTTKQPSLTLGHLYTERPPRLGRLPDICHIPYQTRVQFL